MIYFKQGVECNGVDPHIFDAITAAYHIYERYGLNLTVTSLTDGKHMSGSKHYKGKAVDLRVSNIPSKDFEPLKKYLFAWFKEPTWTILFEKDHFHIQFND